MNFICMPFVVWQGCSSCLNDHVELDTQVHLL